MVAPHVLKDEVCLVSESAFATFPRAYSLSRQRVLTCGEAISAS